MSLQSYSTSQAARGAKLAYWNELNSRLFVPLQVTPANDADFEAAVRFGRLGAVTIAKASIRPATIEHTAEHVERTAERWFSLMMPVEGGMQLSQYGRSTKLAAGDFALCDSQAPSRLSYDEPTHVLSLRLTPRDLTPHIPNPEALCALGMRGDRNPGCIVRSVLPVLWDQVEGGLTFEHGQPLANSLLEFIATSYAIAYGEMLEDFPVRSIRRIQIRRLVEVRLRDPELGVASVAAELNVSTRYLQRVFAGEDESLSAYILRRRLEECAQRLRSPQWSHRTVTEIALGWGFRSTAHFSRAFKERFGTSPREYRRAGGTMGG